MLPTPIIANNQLSHGPRTARDDWMTSSSN